MNEILGNLIASVPQVRCGESEYPVLSMTMREGIVLQNDRFNKRIASVDLSNYKVVRRGQLVVGFPINEGVIYPQKIVDAGIMSPAYNVWDINQSKVNIDYLDYCLHSPASMHYYASKLRGSTARRRSMPKEHLLELPIYLPTLDIQRQIAAAFDRAQSIITVRREQIAVLEKLTKDLFVDMFGDPVKNDNGWEVKLLGDISVVRIGPFGSLLHKDDYILGGVPLINPQHMVNGIITIDNRFSIPENKYKEMLSYDLKENDIVLGRRGEIGRCAIVGKEHLPAICGTGSMVVRLDKKQAHPTYIHALFYQPSFMQGLEEKATGSTMKNINAGIVKGLSVQLPSIGYQQAYADRLTAINRQKSRLTASLAELETLYQSMTERAFSGELF